MLALVLTQRPDTPAEIREVAEPSASPHEAIVEVHAFSLNRGELRLFATRPEGWRPGQDVAGVVIRQAADGSGPPEGSRVVALVDQAGWSQRVAAQTAHMATLPDDVSFAAAATLPIAGITALRTLRYGGFLLGRRVLITGAAGGVGRFAVELAARAGARVTGVVGGPERAEGLQELGAAEVVTRLEDLSDLFDLILESVGGNMLATAIHHVAPNGTVVVFGNSSGESTSISFGDFAGRAGVRLQSYVSYLSGTPESYGEDLALLVSLIADGKLHPQIGSDRSWRELLQAIHDLRERHIPGKAVFHID